MPRIQINDLPGLEDLTAEQMKNVFGGATAIEYGLIAARVSVAVVGAVRSIDTKLAGQFGTINQPISAAAPATRRTR